MTYKVTFDNNHVKYFDDTQILAERLAVYSEIVYNQDEVRNNLINYLLEDNDNNVNKMDEDKQLLVALSDACDRAIDEEDDNKLDEYYHLYSNHFYNLIDISKEFAADYLNMLTYNRYFDIETEDE